MIITLVGAKGSGKDTVGRILSQKHGIPTDSFASTIKSIVTTVFEFDHEDVYGDSRRRDQQYKQYPMAGVCLRRGCGGKLGAPYEGNAAFSDDPPKSFRACKVCETIYPTYLTPRIALQTLGTEWGRDLVDDVWAKQAIAKYPHGDVVFTDGRFENEINATIAAGGHCVRLTRKWGTGTDTHQSESEMLKIPDEKFSYVLDNANMTLEELPVAVDDMLKVLGGLRCG